MSKVKQCYAALWHDACIYPLLFIQVWLEYGLFSARQGQHGRAQQCFRAVLEIDPDHSRTQLLLACLLWHSSMFTDAAHQAEALAWLEAVASTQESAKAEAIRQAILAPQPPMSGATPSAQSATWQVIMVHD